MATFGALAFSGVVMPPILTAAQLAERLHVVPATVLAWYRRGLIPALRASKRPVLFDQEAVEQALAQRAAARQAGHGQEGNRTSGTGPASWHVR